MTTFSFTPSVQQAFQFQPTLDGQTYNAIVTWNVYGKRYYVNLYDQDNILIFAMPLIGSPIGVDIAVVEWSNGYVNMTTDVPHGYVLGATFPLVINGMNPNEYNGTVTAFITGRDTFQFPLALDPGDPTAFGMVNYNVNIAGGYFASSLVWRPASGQFEVTP